MRDFSDVILGVDHFAKRFGVMEQRLGIVDYEVNIGYHLPGRIQVLFPFDNKVRMDLGKVVNRTVLVALISGRRLSALKQGHLRLVEQHPLNAAVWDMLSFEEVAAVENDH